MGVIFGYVCFRLCVIECSYVSVCTGTHLYVFKHISTVYWREGMGRRKRVREEETGQGEGNGSLQSEFLFLSNFTVTKDVF